MVIPISLDSCPLVLVKLVLVKLVLVKRPHGRVAFNPNSELLLNQAPALIYSSYAQQEHKLNVIAIIIVFSFLI